MPKYLIQSHKFSGYYKNPFKQDGKGIKFTPWKTIAAVANQSEAETMWEGLHAGRNVGMLERFRVVFKGVVIVTDRGVVKKIVTDSDGISWPGFDKTLKGYEGL